MNVKNDTIYAHIDHASVPERFQSLEEHSANVAELAKEFSLPFSDGERAFLTGRLHDIGKRNPAFQRHIIEENNEIVDHSIVGAAILLNHNYIKAAFCVAGHHSGLPDKGNRATPGLVTRYSKYNSKKLAGLEDIVVEDIQAETPFSETDKMNFFLETHFLFSCLVDADWLDTEYFISGHRRMCLYDSWDIITSRIECQVNKYLEKSIPSPIIEGRNTILSHSIEMGRQNPALFSFSGPTGSGKTFSSMAFACSQIKNNPSLRRIIYVIPYTSIIEQTADVLRKIAGSNNVLEHQSLTDYSIYRTNDIDSDEPDAYIKAAKYATENWDMPIIVTSNVQFFESIFSNKTSRNRKLHNIAGSVIIFDEVQMLPIKYLKLCLKTIDALVSNFGCSCVLCSATQADYVEIAKIRKPIEIVDELPLMRKLFRKNTISMIDGIIDYCSLADRLSSHNQVLAILNFKDDVRKVFELISSEGAFYLTTNLTPYDRKRKIREIRKCLEEGKTCRVVATSLIEAGVDFDFPVVYREVNGLDSIYQAAGRCNREGLRSWQDSHVYVFDTGRSLTRHHDIQKKVSILRSINDLNSPEAIKNYYSSLFDILVSNGSTDIVFLDIVKNGFMDFETISNSVNLIDTETSDIIVPIAMVNDDIIKDLLSGNIKKEVLRSASQYVVSLYSTRIPELLNRKLIKPIEHCENLFLLSANMAYNGDKFGLSVEGFDAEAIIF